MKLKSLLLPAAALGTAAALIVPAERTDAYSIIHSGLSTAQRDFRVWNNFNDNAANNNQTPQLNYPGATGAVMAIWKGHIEWQSILHGTGTGDPTQAGLGSGGANFDPTWQGAHPNAGGINDNVVSTISSCSGGTLAYTESPGTNGWRIRFCENWTWDDGPGGIGGNNFDIQGVACHEYGHALGLGHSTSLAATMYPSIGSGDESARSIAADDINGIKAIYGTMASGKPTITQVCITGNQMTVEGTNFTPTNNQVWFTRNGTGTGQPLLVSGIPSATGTSLVVTIPAAAGPGDILVKRAASGDASLSNAWPSDLQPGGGNCTPPCLDPVNYCSTSPNSVGNGATMGYTGTTSVSAEDLALWAFACPPNQLGIFYYGENQASVPFGDGLRCVSGGILPTFRLPIVQVDSFGDASYSLDWNSPPVGSGNGQIFDGSVWNFQFWYRDPANGMSGFNLSDGLNIEFCP